MIIITADHGEFIGDHGFISHGYLPWDSLIKVPFILSYPKLTKREIRVKELTQSIDIMPTILEICSIKIPAGKSLDGTVLLKHPDKAAPSRKAVFGNNYIRTKKYKYILDKGLLYDIKQDPEEKNNIAQDKPVVKKELIKMHEESMKFYEDRYSKSMRNKTPDYSFYFTTTHMILEPKDATEECNIHYKKIPKFLTTNNSSINKTWLSDTAWDSEGIYYLPDKTYQSPITLSVSILNGSYKIYLLLASNENIYSTAEKFGMKCRFRKEAPFQCPLSMKLFRVSGNPFGYYYYLSFGNTIVKDKKFFVEIDFRPEFNKIYLIRLIKFIPEGIKDEDTEKNMDFKNKEFEQTQETLKSLGYL